MPRRRASAPGLSGSTRDTQQDATAAPVTRQMAGAGHSGKGGRQTAARHNQRQAGPAPSGPAPSPAPPPAAASSSISCSGLHRPAGRRETANRSARTPAKQASSAPRMMPGACAPAAAAAAGKRLTERVMTIRKNTAGGDRPRAPWRNATRAVRDRRHAHHGPRTPVSARRRTVSAAPGGGCGVVRMTIRLPCAVCAAMHAGWSAPRR